MPDFGFWGLAIDANDVKSLAEFWRDTANYEIVDTNFPWVAVLTSDEPAQPRIIILQVPENKTAKNRVHLEFNTDDLKSEADRIVALGATLVAEREFGDTRWIVMQDPEGNEFCLVDPDH
ncbi:MAG: VOC family protein [Chloroflexi bacterium]|nr:VOC family protein [Chloroflexota bacterium]